MATQPKLENVYYRPAPPPSSVEEVQESVPQPSEPLAQWEDNRGDRFVYAVWMTCFALLAAVTLWNTLYGFLFGHR